MNASELSGTALDWAVAKAEGIERIVDLFQYKPTIDWSIGGPIIEREKIELRNWGTETWIAQIVLTQEGLSPLIAAMRCYVASKLGNEINIPEELSAIC